jgi:tRNA G18 (ribose-2'-O)-methylase SpoU
MLLAVDDPDDPRIAVFTGLRDHDLRRRREAPGGDLDGVFIAEGDVVVDRALRAGYTPLAVLVDAARPSTASGLSGLADVPIYAAGPAVLQRITGMGVHRGAMACFARRPLPTPAEVVAGARRVVVLERVNNPNNVGLIVRSAAGLGVDALLLDRASCDPLYRRAARVAMGEVYALPYAWIDRPPQGVAPLAAEGFTLVALTPGSDAEPLNEVRFSPGERVALLLGSEGEGLSPEALAAAHRRVAIPMHRRVDSLNVGVAAAVAMYALDHATVSLR